MPGAAAGQDALPSSPVSTKPGSRPYEPCGEVLRDGSTCAAKLGHKDRHRNAEVLERKRKAARDKDSARRAEPATDYRKTAAYRQRHAEYMRLRRRYWRDITDALKVMRGCAACGFSSDRAGYFDLDHVKRADKTADITKLVNVLSPFQGEDAKRLIDEISKCQVLCVACHRDKTAKGL